MATIFEWCKSRKRKTNLSGFQSLSTSGVMIDLDGPFRDNIRSFLQEYGKKIEHHFNGMPAWSTLLVSHTNGVVFPLYIIEETAQHSLNPYCDHCKCIGNLYIYIYMN